MSETSKGPSPHLGHNEKTPITSPHQRIFQSVESLRAKAHGTGLEKLLSWFPDPKQAESLKNASKEAKAAHTVDALGRMVDWMDATDMLHVYRPQDGGTAAGRLGLTYDQSLALFTDVTKITRDINEYTKATVHELSEGDFPFIATHLKTAGQALGFGMVMREELSRQKNNDEIINVEVEFADGAAKLESDFGDGYVYMTDAPRDTPIIKSEYTPETETLRLLVPAA